MLPYHYYFIMLMAVLTVSLLRGRRLFDEVLEALHTQHPDRWQALGRPIGFFWQPEGTTWAEGTRARATCFWAWMRATPDFLRSLPALHRKLRWSRIAILLSYIGFLLSGIGLFYLQITHAP